MATESKCKGCGADILWVTTDRGSMMPLSVASKQKRVVVKPLQGDRLIGSVVDTYVSHFVDCPRAGSFRRSAP